MATSTLIFVMLGIGTITVNLMKLICWLDQPQSKRRGRAAV